METVMDFNPDTTRSFYYKSTNQFKKFFTSIISKRSSIQYKFQTVLVVYSMTISIFMLSAANYEFADGFKLDGKNIATIAESIANASIYIMLGIFSVLFSIAIIWIFTKRHSESYSRNVQILYSIGADENLIYSCFKRYATRKMLTSLLLGYAVGYAVTLLVFFLGEYTFYINFPFLLCNILLGVVYCCAYIFSMKKYYKIICENNTMWQGGESNGTA